MEMRQVEYFRALCEELNFTRAAKRCGISQPALTRSIRRLEEEFGGQLFHRDGGKKRLSELARIVKPHLDQVFEQSRAAAARALSFRESKIAKLTLGVMCTVAPTDLIELLAGARTRHHEFDLEIADADAATIYRRLLDGELEAAIVGKPERELRSPELRYVPLYRERFVIVCARGHPLSSLDPVRGVDLAEEGYLLRINCEMANLSRSVLKSQGISLRTVYKSDRDDWILAMTAAGLGFAFMPSRSVNHPEVVARPLVEPEFWREVSLVTVRGRPHSAAVAALVHEAMRSAWAKHRPRAPSTVVSESA
jgi:DNA-binding transcriptional LysR family regulator